MEHVKKRNNNPHILRKMSDEHYKDMYARNKDIIRHVGAFVSHYKRLNSLSYRQVARQVGCGTMTVYYICNEPRLLYCSISLLTGVAASFGCNLLDWLRSPVPGEVEKRAEIEGQAGVSSPFGK